MSVGPDWRADLLGLESLLHRDTMAFGYGRHLSVELGISSLLVFAFLWGRGRVLFTSYFSEPLGNSRESFPEVFL